MTEHQSEKPRIILAAGGTGGHLFPALALADELISRGADVMVATDDRGARFKQENSDYKVRLIASATLQPGLIGKFRTFFNLGIGLLQSMKLILRYKPDVVIGFGGYPAFPPVYAAQVLGRKTVIHESNAVLGKANQMLARLASKIAISLPQTKGVTDTDKLKAKAITTGNPVRAEIVAKTAAPYPALSDSGPIRIFIMGGSQGARIFSDILPVAAGLLPDQIRNRLHIVQQCRPEDLERTKDTYKTLKIHADLQVFFKDVAAQLEACHLLIGRAGASTVSDVAVIGRPALFVPLHHADQQQTINANVIRDAGGGWVMAEDEFTADALAARLEGMFAMPDGLKQAAAKAASTGKPDAAERLADLVLDLKR